MRYNLAVAETALDEMAEAAGVEEYSMDDSGEELEEAVVLADDSPNLAIDLETHPDGEALRKAIGDRVHRHFTDAFDSTEEYRETAAKNWKLFAGDLPAKSHPWENCANMHVPLLLEHMSRISSRVLSEVFGDFQNFHSFAPVNEETQSRDVGEVLTIHSNWQFRTQIQDFPRQMERMMLACLTFGDATIHSHRDSFMNANRHETCTPDDFVIPYTYVTTQPDYSDVPFRCKVLNYYRYQIQAMRDAWYDIDAVLENRSSHDDEPEAKIRDALAETQGHEPSENDDSAPRKLIMYEGWCELLNDVLPDEGRDRFLQVIIDYNTRHVLSITVHEEPDWRDQQRQDLQFGELQAYEQAMMGWAQQQEAVDMGMSLIAPPAPQPQPPDWYIPGEVEQPPPVKKTPIHSFVHLVDIENLLGSLGIGHGRIVADLNRVANTVTNQIIDAASLANGGGYFTTLDFKKPIKWGPNVVNKLEGYSPEELKNGLVPMQIPGANPQLMEVKKFAEESAEKVMQAGEVLSGTPGKSGETWRGHSARIEQATKSLAHIAGKVKLIAKKIVENNSRLNEIFLPESEIVMVADHLGGTIPITIGREMYGKRYAIEVNSDLRFATRAQRTGEADEVLMMIMKLPPLQSNPAIVHAALVEAFKARGMTEMVKLLGPPPPPGQAPPQPAAGPGPQGGPPQGGPPQAPPPQAGPPRPE